MGASAMGSFDAEHHALVDWHDFVHFGRGLRRLLDDNGILLGTDAGLGAYGRQSDCNRCYTAASRR